MHVSVIFPVYRKGTISIGGISCFYNPTPAPQTKIHSTFNITRSTTISPTASSQTSTRKTHLYFFSSRHLHYHGPACPPSTPHSPLHPLPLAAQNKPTSTLLPKPLIHTALNSPLAQINVQLPVSLHPIRLGWVVVGRFGT